TRTARNRPLARTTGAGWPSICASQPSSNASVTTSTPGAPSSAATSSSSAVRDTILADAPPGTGCSGARAPPPGAPEQDLGVGVEAGIEQRGERVAFDGTLALDHVRGWLGIRHAEKLQRADVRSRQDSQRLAAP